MAMTQATALTAVRDRLAEEDYAAFYSDAQIRAWLNEGVREVARQTLWKRTSSTVAVTAGTRYYTAPAAAIQIYRVEYLPTGSSQIYRLEYADINAMDIVWGTNQAIGRSTPEMYTLVSANPLSIQVSPTPAVGGNLKVYYYAMPTDLATDGTAASSNLDVPGGWEDLPVEWATSIGYRKARDLPNYQMAAAQFERTLDRMTELVARYTDEATQWTPHWNNWGWV